MSFFFNKAWTQAQAAGFSAPDLVFMNIALNDVVNAVTDAAAAYCVNKEINFCGQARDKTVKRLWVRSLTISSGVSIALQRAAT
ncbi:hypothetical protein KCP77_24220 [Salmonella enterica subsp. enterica]|nr:hypothetical protein KCP77_24220 [Salmonella enterica subsp. enterica]